MSTAAQEYIGTSIGAVGSGAVNAEVGEAQRLFAEQAEARVQELIETGQSTPFTIANFNPVEVGLQGVLKQYKVPSPYDKRLPDALRFTLPYEGREFLGHALTIRYPKKDGKMTGATGTGQPGEVTAQREPKIYMPREIAYSFMEHFSPVFTARAGTVLPPAPKDARKIYGLLVFEGDIHTLGKALEATDPAKRIIKVPTCHVSTVGKTSIKSFRTTEYSLDEYLEHMLAGQRKFAGATWARAQHRFSGTEQDRADISESDRVWYRWLIQMGYKEEPPKGEKSWLNDDYGLDVQGSKAPSNLRKCPGCLALEPEPFAPFCQKCNRPMDILLTYMGDPERGLPPNHVPDAWLMTLVGEEREIALAEYKRRKQGFGDEPTASETKPRGSYKKARSEGKDPTEEITPAESTAIPGEE